MNTHESIQFNHDLQGIRDGNKAKGIEKLTAKRLVKDETAGEFCDAYLEARRNQRRATRTIRLVDYDPESGKKLKKLDKKATKERDAAMDERRETQQVFVGTHKAFKKFLQGKIDEAAGVSAVKKALGVKVSTKAFVALAELWAKHTGFVAKETDDSDDKPAKRAAKVEKKTAKRRAKKDESDSSDDESDSSDADEKPAKKASKKAAKAEKPVKRAKPTKKSVVEDSDDESDFDSDESDDESD